MACLRLMRTKEESESASLSFFTHRSHFKSPAWQFGEGTSPFKDEATHSDEDQCRLAEPLAHEDIASESSLRCEHGQLVRKPTILLFPSLLLPYHGQKHPTFLGVLLHLSKGFTQSGSSISGRPFYGKILADASTCCAPVETGDLMPSTLLGDFRWQCDRC